MQANQLVQIQNDQPITTSLLVAEKFGKRHTHVLDAIRNITHSAKNSAQFYASTTYKDSTNRENTMVIMNRDGFSLLVMGFTGQQAIQFKIEFIQAFNQMEKKLKQQQEAKQLPSKKELAQWVIDLSNQKEVAERRIKEQKKLLHEYKPKAQFADQVFKYDNNWVDMGEVTRILELPFGRNTLFKKLREDKILTNDNRPMQYYVNLGYFKMKQVWINHGQGFTQTKTYATQKGLNFLRKKYKKDPQHIIKFDRTTATSRRI